MTVYVLGPVFGESSDPAPDPGVSGMNRRLGGSGAGISVAAARAAAHVVHIGTVGSEDRWAVERLLEYGVDTRHITVATGVTERSGHIGDAGGLQTKGQYPGTGQSVPLRAIRAALNTAQPGDIFVTGRQTKALAEAAAIAHDLGLRVVCASELFSAEAVLVVMPLIDLLVLSAAEAAEFCMKTGSDIGDLPVRDIVVTRGGDGSTWYSKEAYPADFPATPVATVDATGAGDTFTGYLTAGLDRGLPMAQAIGLATRAGALMVSRQGGADVIPDLKEIEDFALR